ncbi:hypothetical protein O181_018160 [Austropuccinia psidii MF-1]|uniref:Uncharacterized protein n=1 Tax=Austropuccinia psidii MF-1 TaxID=1389203 RepID=A0A9Q3C868_9BASI|nr:hypothetical protein [Austropuccinia psidii MF-1]
MSPVHLRNIGFQRNWPEDIEGLSRTRRPGRGHLGHSEPQTRGLERYVSRSSAPPTQRFISMEHGQQEVQPGIPGGRTWSRLPEDLSQRDRLQGPYGNHQRLEFHQAVQTPGVEGEQDKRESKHYPSYRRTADPERAYSDSFRLTRRRSNQRSISRRRQGYNGKKQDHLQTKEDRVTPNDLEAVGFGERSTQEPELVVHNSRTSSPINRNTTPTQIEHNIFTPESNLNSDVLWLQMSQYPEQTEKQFSELEATHERMKILTASMDKIVDNLKEGHV